MIKEKIPQEKLNEVKDTIKTSARLLALVWRVDKLFILGIAASTTIPAIIPFINIYIYKLVIDRVVEVIQGVPLELSRFYPLLALRIFTYFIQDVAFTSQGFMERVLWAKIPMYISQLVFQKVSSLDIQYFEDSKFKDLLEKVRDSYSHRPVQLIDFLFYGLQSIIQVMIALVAIAKLNLLLVLPVTLVAIPEFISQAQRSKLAWGVWSQNTPLRKRFWYLSHIIQDARSIKEIKIFKLAKKFIDEVTSLQEGFYKDNISIARKNYNFDLLFSGFSTAVFIGVEVYVIFQALTKKLTIGDINFYTGVVSNFQNGLGGLFRNINGIFDSSLYVKSIFEVLDLKPLVKQPDNPVKINIKKAPKIEFKNVFFTYPGTKKAILKNFSITIEPGEKVAFVGENGAGKTTIIKLLARFYDVDKGKILIDGVSINQLDIDNWYKYFGVLFQDFNRYEHTVEENIGFGRVYDNVGLEEIIEASTSAGAHSMIEKLDKGYKQMLGRIFDEGIDLSTGQWQKIALARAFLRNAPVLVLDEPTSSIDAKAEAEIFNKVEKLSKDKTVIIISHRFSTVRNADKIYVIDSGKITESGTHSELIKLNKQYATLFNLQAKGYL